jgi:polar amino acid transport system substrate-binding protein
VSYGFFPWNRSYTYVESGEWNASAIWGKTEEREAHCLFSDVLYSGESVLFFLKNKPLTWTGNTSDIKGLKIGLPLGSAKGKLLEKAETDGLVTYDIGGDQVGIYKKLLAQHIDAVDETKSIGWNIIQTNFSKDDIDKFDCTTPYETWDYSVIFSKEIDRNNYYLKIFNEGLQEMKQNGRFDAIWEAFYRGEYN